MVCGKYQSWLKLLWHIYISSWLKWFGGVDKHLFGTLEKKKSAKYEEEKAELYKLYKTRRARGLVVDSEYFQAKMRALVKMSDEKTKFKAQQLAQKVQACLATKNDEQKIQIDSRKDTADKELPLLHCVPNGYRRTLKIEKRNRLTFNPQTCVCQHHQIFPSQNSRKKPRNNTPSMVFWKL